MSRVLILGCDTQLSQQIGHALSDARLPMEYVAGPANALTLLRVRSFGVVITSPQTSFEEDIALLNQMRQIRPGLRFIVLAGHTTPEEVIAALRAHVFACFTPPFHIREIVSIIRDAIPDTPWEDDIEVLSARPGWVSVRANCRLITADRLLTFERDLNSHLPEETQLDLMQALREILLNAMEHGAGYDPTKVVEVTAVRTGRALVFYVRDPGHGFRMESLTHAAVNNPPDNPAAHIILREKEGMRPGGFGLLIAAGTMDELIYNEIGNEVVMIKYL
jgi:anti-sigma regulatory factor (Ser/Thr protein kinase)/ActR/RegA family two-component response regulator